MPKNRPPAKPFVKNDPRINRKGRPMLNKAFGQYVRDFIEEDEEGKKKSIVEEMMTIAVRRAKMGQFQFWDAIVNRAYGKVPDKVEINEQEKPDLSKLSKDELETWMQLLEKAKSQ